MSEKKRPIEERVAEMFGRSAFVDIRNGIGGTGPMKLETKDVAQAVGVVQTRLGELPVLVLETNFGGLERHEAALLRYWDATISTKDREARTIHRIGGKLALSQFSTARSGLSLPPRVTDDLAWLVVCQRSRIDAAKVQALDWINDLYGAALAELRAVLSNGDHLLVKKQKVA